MAVGTSMNLFLCGLIVGLGIGAVAAYLTCTRLIIPGVVGLSIGTVLERLYRRGLLEIDPADESGFLQAIENVKQYPWDWSGGCVPDSGPRQTKSPDRLSCGVG
jgi:hypothetical protein